MPLYLYIYIYIIYYAQAACCPSWQPGRHNPASRVPLSRAEARVKLCDLSWRPSAHKQPGLSIIWAFAMTKVGAMKQTCHTGTPWQVHHVEDHPDGFFPVLAYLHLASHLRNQDDGTILRYLLDDYVSMGCPEAPLWPTWEFAIAKREASSTNGAQIQMQPFHDDC